MSVIARSLDDAESWQIVYDTEARRFSVECASDGEAKQFSINDFLAQARGTRAQTMLEGLILDMFPNTSKDDDRA